MTFHPKIFVINIACETERMRNVAAAFSNEKMSFERFEAINGSDIPNEDWKNLHSKFWYWLMHGRPITAGVLGCALSHRAIFKRIIDEKISCALIVEDDIVLDKNFAKKLDEIELSTRDFDMIQIFCFRHPDYFVRKSNNGSFDIKTFRNLHASTAGYLLRNSGADKLLKIKKVMTTADRWCWQSAITGLKCCGIVPMPIFLHETLSLQSSIGRIDMIETLQSASSTPVKNTLWKWFILPLSSLLKIGVLRMRGL